MLIKTFLFVLLFTILVICGLVLFVLYIWPFLVMIFITVFNAIRNFFRSLLGLKHTHGPFHHPAPGEKNQKGEEKDEKKEKKEANPKKEELFSKFNSYKEKFD